MKIKGFQVSTSTFPLSSLSLQNPTWSGQHRFEDTMHRCALFKLVSWPSCILHDVVLYSRRIQRPGCLIRGRVMPLMFLSAGSGRKSWENHLCFVSILALHLCQIVRQTRQLPPYHNKASAKPLTPSSACPSCLKCYEMPLQNASQVCNNFANWAG